MKSPSISLLLLCAIGQMATAENNPIAGLDPVLFSEAGWQWGAFNEPTSTIEFNSSSMTLYIPPADDDGEYPGTVNGGIGVNFGSDARGFLDFDHTNYQIEMPIRILEDNESSLFRIVLADSDGTGASDDFYYHVNPFDFEVGEWDTFVRPLAEFDELISNGGDGEMNFGQSIVQLTSVWNSPELINIEFGGIYISEIDPVPSNTVYELNANSFGQAWSWGSYNVEGAITYTEDSIVINAESQNEEAGAQGGLGHGVLHREFDGEATDLVINARLLAENQAANFLIELRDDEGELNGVISDGVEEIEWAAEQYTYDIPTSAFEMDEFTEFRIPLSDFSTRGQAGGDVNIDGDFELSDFGLYLAHIMSPWGPAETLNIEIESIRLEQSGATLPGDYNGNGQLDAGDLDLQAEVMNGEYNADYDLNGDDVVDAEDRLAWLHDLKGTWLGDADLNGEFNSTDFVQVFQPGEYEDDIAGNSTWASGDWDGDGDFTSSDFVAAFQDGGYEVGPRPTAAVASVPEPASRTLLLISLIGCLMLRASVDRRQR